MHGAGVLGALGQGLVRLLARAKNVTTGIGQELVAALLRAKMVGRSVVVQARLAGIEGDRHAADRVYGRRRTCVLMFMAMMMVIMVVMFVHEATPIVLLRLPIRDDPFS
jgi:hypothetical protein